MLALRLPRIQPVGSLNGPERVIMKNLLLSALLGSILITGGCKFGGPVKMDPVKISYEVKENLVTFEQPRHDLVRVGQFIDKRPKEEVKGNIPPLFSLIVMYMRVGTYRTGDKVWTGGDSSSSVANEISRSMAKCMKDTNFFKEVKSEDSTEPSGGEGMILTGTVESLVGEQDFKNFWIFFFYKKKTFGQAHGTCKITYNLIDAETGQVLKSNTVESVSKESKGTIVKSGLTALGQAQTLVANEVTTRALLDF